MILFRRTACLFLSVLLLPSWGSSQTQSGTAAPAPRAPDSTARPHIALNEYLSEVLRSNLDLSAQRANIAISQSAVTTATVTPDWSFDVGFPTVDLSNQGNPTNFSFGLDVPIELGGKRGRRVRAAKADVATANSDYEDAVRQLRATATGAFIDALGARAILVSKNKSLGQFDRIVTVNQERVRVGEIEPGFRAARANIKKSNRMLGRSEVQRHSYCILHIDEIALLLSVAIIVAVASEKFDATGIHDLRVRFAHQASHLAFVPFVWSEDVKILERDEVIQPTLSPGMQVH